MRYVRANLSAVGAVVLIGPETTPLRAEHWTCDTCGRSLREAEHDQLATFDHAAIYNDDGRLVLLCTAGID